jgi:hypothetical protein
MAIVEGQAEAPGDLLELVELGGQGAQLAKASDELLFEPIDDGHATPQGGFQQDGDCAHIWLRSRPVHATQSPAPTAPVTVERKQSPGLAKRQDGHTNPGTGASLA